MKLRLLLLILFISVQAPGGEILIATVAQVKNHVITSREVQIYYLLDKALGSNNEFFKNENPVEQIIREWLLFYEASTFYNSQLPSSVKNKEIAQVREKIGSSKAWKDLGVTSEELNEMVGRRVEAERLYIFKKKASVLPVSPAEVESEYNQNRIRYGTFSFEEVKGKIRHKKIQQNLENRLSQWFQVLEKKYSVQRFAKYNKDNVR